MSFFPIFKRNLGNPLGFTLNELLTVIAIIGIMASVGAPQFNNWIQKYRVEGQASKVYFDMMAAKSQAIRHNHNMVVTFNSGGNSYKVHSDKNNDGVEDTGENIKSISLENDVVFGVNGGMATDVWGNAIGAAVNISGGGNLLTFNSRGQANTSGAVYLLPAIDASSTNTAHARAIKIVQTTGNIEMVRYAGGSWS